MIGTGVIGTGWIIRMLAYNKKVTAFDLDIKKYESLEKNRKVIQVKTQDLQGQRNQFSKNIKKGQISAL